MPQIFRYCPLTGQLCDQLKLIRRLKGCALAGQYIDNMDECPAGKPTRGRQGGMR